MLDAVVPGRRLPRSARAGRTDLESAHGEVYERLTRNTERLAAIAREEGERHDLPLQVRAWTGVAHAFFAPTPVESYEQACASDHERYRRFARHLLEAGIYVIPRGLLYVSTEHDEEDLEQAREAVRRACVSMRDEERPCC